MLIIRVAVKGGGRGKQLLSCVRGRRKAGLPSVGVERIGGERRVTCFRFGVALVHSGKKERPADTVEREHCLVGFSLIASATLTSNDRGDGGDEREALPRRR